MQGFCQKLPFVEKKIEYLGVLSIPIHTFRMSSTASIQSIFFGAVKWQASKSARRTGWIFTNPKFDFSASMPLAQKPHVRKRTRKPKWAK